MQKPLHSVAALAALLAALLPTPTLHAQIAQIERIDIFDAGIYCADTIQKVADPNAPGGHRNVVTNVRLLKRTTRVPALLGTRFGMRYAIIGTPNGALVNLRLVTKVPPPGLHDQKSGKIIMVNEYAMAGSIGANGYREYHLEYDWEALPGVWSFELWDDKRKRAEQSFTLTKPQADQTRDSLGCAPVIGSIMMTIR